MKHRDLKRTPRPWDGIPIASWIIIFVCIAGFTYTASMRESTTELCVAEYEQARSASDTARIDAFTLSADIPALTCGLKRRDGSIAGYEASR